MSDIIIWILLIFTFLIIIGLYSSEFTPLDLSEKKKILELNYITENFSPSQSTTTDQSSGSSELYNWGLPEEVRYVKKEKVKECHHECKPACAPVCPQKCPPPVQTCTTPVVKNEVCTNCDITTNKDIDKYILKSSVPACPDMSAFITKNMMNANPDLSDYIKKSEIKPCEKVDISKYILKSEIPACPTCPVCPECPICPVCPPEKKCKQISEYKITEHPDMSKYISKEDINKYYIRKDLVEKNKIQEEEHNIKSKIQNKIENKIQHKIENKSKYSSFIDNIYEENAKPMDNLIGYYAGDSLFAGV
jgi:hypothetical protein